jgi:serine/threonine protein kinase
MKDNGRIGNYEVISPIRTESAQGSITTFYKGKDHESNRLLTFRVTHFLDGCEEGKVQEIRRRYFREAEIGKRISHPGIVSVYDAEEADDRIYLAMEYVEGESLTKRRLKLIGCLTSRCLRSTTPVRDSLSMETLLP